MKKLALAAVAVCTLVAGCSGSNSASKTSAPPPPPPPPPPVSVSALEGVLLNQDEVNAVMGANGMTLLGTYTAMPDNSKQVEPACQALASAGTTADYTGSGWTAYHGSDFKEPKDANDHYLDQAVVSFTTADQAKAFYQQAVGKWQQCANHTYNYNDPDPTKQATWAVGPVTDQNGLLSTVKASQGVQGWHCQRAISVANNVAIDVTACGYNEASGANGFAALAIQRIEAKVNTPPPAAQAPQQEK
jgi:serine/threonine kinase PknH